MPEQTSEAVLVVTGLAGSGRRVERGMGDVFAEGAARAVPLAVLKVNMERFLQQLREILAAGNERLGGFDIDRIEVSAQINADGQVCLLGSGVKVAAGGGLTFVLKRASA